MGCLDGQWRGAVSLALVVPAYLTSFYLILHAGDRIRGFMHHRQVFYPEPHPQPLTWGILVHCSPVSGTLPKGLIPLASHKPRTCEVTEAGLGLPSSFLNPLKCRDDRLANTDQITHLFLGALETEHGALCVRGEYCNTEPPAPTNVSVPMWGAVLTRPGQTVSALTKHMLGWAIYTLLVCLIFCLFLIMCNCGYVHMSTRALEAESVGSPGLDS